MHHRASGIVTNAEKDSEQITARRYWVVTMEGS